MSDTNPRDLDARAKTNRRQFIAGTGALAGGILAARATPAAANVPEPQHAVPRGAPALLRSAPDARQTVTRADVTTFTEGSQQLTSLRAGVTAMKARMGSDPTSWQAQANIHNVFCNNPPSGMQPVHYSYRFVAWHRAYLYYFEKILRAASGNPALSLPYWNWSTNLRLPAQYWGNGNPLYDPKRVMTSTQQLNPQRTAINNLLGLSSFALFGGTSGGAGALEVGPHNYVHATVGGDMGQFSTAALDPIFWAHHSNVDRVWYLWNTRGGMNPTDSTWLNISYPFYDVDTGGSVNVTFAQAAALPVTYAAPPAQVVAVSDPQGVSQLSTPQTTPVVQIPASAVASLLGPAQGSAALRVVGVRVPDQPVTVHVFADRPGATRNTTTTDRGFAGAFTLIPTGGNHAHGPVDVHVALGTGFRQAVANKAAAEGAGGGSSLQFTLVPVPHQGNAATANLTYDRLELHVQ
jgi:hypothetical protein